MVSNTNSCLFGCIILLLSLLNNIVCVFANATSNVNRIDQAGAGDDGANASLPLRRFARNDDRMKILDMMNSDETSTNVTSKQRLHDDRLIFGRPSEYRETTTETPVRLNTQNVLSKSNATMQTMLEVDGEYSFGIRLKQGTRHAERGEYEIRNGKQVFIIRGYFGHITPQGDFQFTAYVFDHTGYHEIPVGTGITDFRPDIGGGECDLSTGNYCIDQKLLTLMVG